MHTSLAPYPWQALDRIPRSCLRSLRILREHLDPAGLAARVAEALGAALGGPVGVVPGRSGFWAKDADRIADPVSCLLADADGTLAILVQVDAAFAHGAVSTLLSRAAGWPDRSVPPPRAVHGALGGVAVAVARRLFPDAGFQLRAIHREARPSFSLFDRGDTLYVDAVLRWEGVSHAASLAIASAPRPTAGVTPFGADALLRLGETPLCLHLVGAVAVAPREDLASLCAGDAWMPAEGWMIDTSGRTLQGDVVLIGARADLGLRATLRPNGQIVLGEGTMRVQHDVEGDDASSQGDPAVLAEALADVPVVVRVELGTVTLSAREWAAVRPGDVLTTGTRVAERATLRVGGVAVALGELVDVEGELGVRVHEIRGPSDGGVA